jgi:hypothetical protein
MQLLTSITLQAYPNDTNFSPPRNDKTGFYSVQFHDLNTLSEEFVATSHQSPEKAVTLRVTLKVPGCPEGHF